MVGLRDASLRACALLLQAFGVSSADAVRLLAAQLELTAPSLVAATRAASWAKRLDPASSGALSAAIKSALHQSSEFILEWDRTECPCCGSASALRPHRSNRRRVAIVITQARVIEAATLRLKRCTACGVLVGPGYYTFTSEAPLDGAAALLDGASDAGGRQRHTFFLPHPYHPTVLPVSGAQTCFMQVRLLEELQASRVQCHTSLEALTRVLLQACFSGARVSRAGLHPNGAWLADALDILQIRQACLVQRAHHVAAGAARRALFVVREDLDRPQHGRGTADEDAAGPDEGDSPMDVDGVSGVATLLQECGASGVPVGSLNQLLVELIVQPFKSLAGALGEQHLCMSLTRQPTHVLLVDGTDNVEVRACAVPGCPDAPANGNATWCSRHAGTAGGCRVVVRQPPAGEWLPCASAQQPGRTTCAAHADLDKSHGPANEHELHGDKPSQRHDRLHPPCTPEPSQRGQQQPYSSSSSIMSQGAAYVRRPRVKRPIVVVSCAKCGLVLGAAVRWSGRPETEPAGLTEVCGLVAAVLRRHSMVGPVVCVYNDAVHAQRFLQQAAAPPSELQAVAWAADAFRFLPQLAGVQRGVADPGTHTGGSALHALLEASPFRPELCGRLWRRVDCAGTALLDALQQLLGLLAAADRGSAASGGSSGGGVLEWLQRSSGCRLHIGSAVSWKESMRLLRLAGVLHEGRGAAQALRPPGLEHGRVFLTFTRPSGQPGAESAAGCIRHESGWRVCVVELLVDCEALEQVWRLLQPGTSIGLKSQARGITELWSWLEHANQQTQLDVDYLFEQQQQQQQLGASSTADERPWSRRPLQGVGRPQLAACQGPLMAQRLGVERIT